MGQIIRLLIVNPNTSREMSQALEPVVSTALSGYKNVTVGAFPSINSPNDTDLSASYVFPYLKPLINSYDGILVACYSQHPLVSMLRDELAKSRDKSAWVQGIFEASILKSISLLDSLSDGLFGIVSTGKVWESALAVGVQQMLNESQFTRFAGVQTTELMANELHDLPAKVVNDKMVAAAERLAHQGSVKVVCLGCAGMVGLDAAIMQGFSGVSSTEQPRIVDGIVAGLEWLLTRLVPRNCT
ncbi:hypothetical protein C8J56DRAFT_935203 [Mycena floridula]|nr:hypothetical protein C8J56DRAFT_935203 [Mycena floridula]